MKRVMKLSAALLLILVVSSKIYSQADENMIKSNLTNLFNYSKSKSFEKAAELIVYEGEDKNRIDKDSFNPANKEEVNQAKRICKKISALIELSSKYDFNNVITKTINGKEVYNIDVNFVSGDQKLVTGFTFLKTQKGYLLLNMN